MDWVISHKPPTIHMLNPSLQCNYWRQVFKTLGCIDIKERLYENTARRWPCANGGLKRNQCHQHLGLGLPVSRTMDDDFLWSELVNVCCVIKRPETRLTCPESIWMCPALNDSVFESNSLDPSHFTLSINAKKDRLCTSCLHKGQPSSVSKAKDTNWWIIYSRQSITLPESTQIISETPGARTYQPQQMQPCHQDYKKPTTLRRRWRKKVWSPGHFHEPCPGELLEERTPASVLGLQSKCISRLTLSLY